MRSMQDSLSKKSTQVYMTNEAAGHEVFQKNDREQGVHAF
jgi:hypothetical protein